ncbi:hypothetical protein ACFQX6_00400 [Streptosporangium lutulentum]
MLAGGLVAAMTAGVIAVQTFNPAAPASAAEVLRLAAEAASATPWPEPRDDQYLHYERIAETRSENGVPNVGPRHITGEVWESVDGSRPELWWHKPSKSHPQDREYKELLTRCPSGPGAGRSAYADLRGWPTDQEQLRHKLAELGNKMVLKRTPRPRSGAPSSASSAARSRPSSRQPSSRSPRPCRASRRKSSRTSPAHRASP